MEMQFYPIDSGLPGRDTCAGISWAGYRQILCVRISDIIRWILTGLLG